MQLRDQVNYAYILIGLMKESMKRSLDDPFTLDDLDLRKINLCNIALGTISLISFQQVLCLIERERNYQLELHKVLPTYADMRRTFKPDAFFR